MAEYSKTITESMVKELDRSGAIQKFRNGPSSPTGDFSSDSLKTNYNILSGWKDKLDETGAKTVNDLTSQMRTKKDEIVLQGKVALGAYASDKAREATTEEEKKYWEDIKERREEIVEEELKNTDSDRLKDFNKTKNLAESMLPDALKIKNKKTEEANKRSKEAADEITNTMAAANGGVGGTKQQEVELKPGEEVNPQDVDFFKLYGLGYYEGENTFGTFLPIQLTSTPIFGGDGFQGWDKTGTNTTSKSMEGETDKVRIVLPWEVKSFTDNASVQISKRSDSPLSNIAQNILNKVTTGSNLSENLEGFIKILGFDYKGETLNKEIRLPFILPLSSRNVNVTREWCDNVRRALGILQGQVYPHGMWNNLPNLFNLKFGNLYRGFRGFITGVTYTYGEDYYTNETGDVCFPIVITGEITFRNIFFYSWSKESDVTSKLVSDRFNLAKEPGLLFGEWSNANTSGDVNASGLRPDEVNKEYEKWKSDNAEKLKGKSEKEIQEMYEKEKGYSPQDYNKYENPKMQEQADKTKEKADKETKKLDETNQKTSDGLNEINNTTDRDEHEPGENTIRAQTSKTVDSLGQMRNDTNNLFGNLQSILQTAKNVSNTVNNIRNGNYLGALSNLSTTFKTLSPSFSKTAQGLYNIASAGVNVSKSLKNGVNLESLGGILSNTQTLCNAIQMANNKEDFAKVVAGTNITTNNIFRNGTNALETLNKNAQNISEKTVGKAASVINVGIANLTASLFGGLKTQEGTEKASQPADFSEDEDKENEE